jgi:putative ABC transport system substrate-binding protein
MIRRREFITLLGGAATWPLVARAQQPGMSVIGVVTSGTPRPSGLAAFGAGLLETGYVDGKNVSIENHALEGQFDRTPALVAELIRRRVAVIATPASVAGALAAKAATATIPIVFGVNDDPVRLGLVANLARPGGNLTGMNFFSQEAVPKRLELLHELVPKANRVAVLINSSNSAAASETTLRGAREAADVMGLSIDILRASTSHDIEVAFATMVREQIEALFIAGDAFFNSRAVQFVTPMALLRRQPSASLLKLAG